MVLLLHFSCLFPNKINTCCDDGNIPRREECKEQSGAGTNLVALLGQRHREALSAEPVMPSQPHEQPGQADGWWDPW